MSPVHVIVGQEPRAEQKWLEAFGGAVDVYRFDRNVDAFERLMVAEAPIDLVIITPAQAGPFNLTPDQLIARVLEGPLATSPMLANLHIIVVGGTVAREHPRVVSLRTLDAAIHLVKFGDVQEAPRPAPRPIAPRQEAPRMTTAAATATTGSISESVISRIWAAADAAASAPSAPVAAAPVAPAPIAQPQPKVTSAAAGILGGGPKAAPRLFASAGQKRPAKPLAQVPDSAKPRPRPQPIMGGGAAQQAHGAPSHDPELSFGGLKPSRPYQLPNGAGYRGPAMRGTQIPAASHINAPNATAVATTAQPVPPALASQVRAMVFNSAPSQDPVLAFSGSVAPAAAPVHVQAPAAPVMQPMAPQPVQTPVVPMDPPAGVYGSAPAATAPAQPQVSAPPVPSAGVQADPFVQRAARESGGGVSFG